MRLSERLLVSRTMHNLTSCRPWPGYQLPFSRLLVRQFLVDTKIEESAIEVYELKFQEHGKTFTDAMIHLKKGFRPDDKHSVKNYLLGNEATRMSPAVLELLIEAKNREIKAVPDAPPFSHETTEWVEMALESLFDFPGSPSSLRIHFLVGKKNEKLTPPDSWLKFNFAQDIYSIERDHFVTIQIETKHLGLNNHDIKAYLQSRYTASPRGPISVWAWKCEDARMSRPERTGLDR